MKALPEELETSALIGCVTDGWGIDVRVVDYAAVGFGSYHWVAHDPDGMPVFITVDDLDHKPWLGSDRASAFDGLRRAFDTAASLQDAGLGFVVAPMRTPGGETVRRCGPRHTVAVFPFVDGEAGAFGHRDPAERAAVVRMLAELHRAPPRAGTQASRVGVELPGRSELQAALDQLDQPWHGGPYSEPSRAALAARASDMTELLGLADRLAADVIGHGGDCVITHGEPHAANVMRTGEHRVLVDWDTVAIAPAERDMWMVTRDTADARSIYAAATGRDVDQAALDFFRLAWDLKDLAEYLNLVRSPHRHTEDTAKAYHGLTRCVAIRDTWSTLLG